MAQTPAQRMKLHRRRQARGIAIVRIEVDHGLIEQMIATGMISESSALDADTLAAAAGRALRDAVRRAAGGIGPR